MDRFKWSRELNCILIMHYELHENLYNVNHPNYNNKVKRAQSFKEICTELKKIEKCLTIEGIKKKAHTLRTQYLKEYRRVQNADKCGEVYEPVLWCYENLDFLKNFCDVNKTVTKSNLTVNKPKYKYDQSSSPTIDVDYTPREGKTRSLYSDEQDSSGMSDVDYEPPKRKDNMCKMEEVFIDASSTASDNEEVTLKKNESSHSLLQKQIMSMKAHFTKRSEKEYDWLGKQVVFEINKIEDKGIKQDTAWAIQSIIREHVKKDRLLRMQANATESNERAHAASTSKKIKYSKRFSDPLQDA